MKKSLRPGEQVEVRIEDVAFGGDGIGHVEEMVLFVPFTATGDEVIAEITVVKKNYTRGKITRVLQSSDLRTAPACPYYTICGGCCYQHIDYKHQLQLKEKQVKDAFIRIGKFQNPPVAETIPSPQPYNYRGKAEFQIQVDVQSKVMVGFMQEGSNTVVNIEFCALVDTTVNEAYRKFREGLVCGRKGFVDGSKKIIWSDVSGEEAARLLSRYEKGRFITRHVNGKVFLVPRRGFFQANTLLAGSLVDHVVAMCELTGRETVLDAYCGSGLFSCFLAPGARRLFGVEVDAQAVNCARENLRCAGFKNATFFRGDAAQVILKRILPADVSVDVMVLDPPRLGLTREMLSVIKEAAPSRIVYISCNPATQARDINHLVTAHGYALKRLQPFDMFPQTAHIETVGLLTKIQI